MGPDHFGPGSLDQSAKTGRYDIRMIIVSSNAVAPLTGAWIETCQPILISLLLSSRPSRARGLKRANEVVIPPPTPVAPHTGAWIEKGIS